ncbi:trans-aconitate 2-methyltransferase [Buttiauxella sp. S04-F03]|uniref:trans-aconitate 2-methyltransferase n=1 Tax=Buttiauxella sp. W03-F01 TaxID=2904524 RepID=UPI001E29F189|nr:trans-aconitate 2-methyltransferase [Buttiauxella sp. W03-F01]MCE0799297.1 trans-aconitate 2-methyltransferase [Buttiauxella sp. W03-F01]
MQDWNPALYLQFAAERTRPAAELAARIQHPEAKHIADLGCGPGNSTALLHQAFPNATVTGIDSSPAMLEKARSALPNCQFEQADVTSWTPAIKPDVIYANASLQWVSNHPELFPHLAAQLAENGVLAVQMPDNWQEPTHTLMRQVAAELGSPDSGREALLPAQQYYDLLAQSGCTVDIWRTTYFHVMPSAQAIIEWLSSTGLRPYLANLDAIQQEAFLERYHQLLQQAYPPRHDGNVLMLFPRLFIVARKTIA